MYANRTNVENRSACSSPFKIKTFVFVSTAKPTVDFTLHTSFPKCEGIAGDFNFGTKGFLFTRVIVNDVPINFVNTHMPFKSEAASAEFYRNMMAALEYRSKDHIVIFGDVNSRSLLTPECYKKDVDACDDIALMRGGSIQGANVSWTIPSGSAMNAMRKKMRPQMRPEMRPQMRPEMRPLTPREPENIKGTMGFCKVRMLLESAEFEDTVGSVSKNANQNNARDEPRLEACSSRKGANGCSIAPNSVSGDYKTLVRRLLDRDLIGNPPCNIGIFAGFKEHKIDFLPTYKRNKSTGRFELTKVDKIMGIFKKSTVRGRLPGYADRIFFKDTDERSNKMSCNLYTSMPITGNDHVPIYAKFAIEPSNEYAFPAEDKVRRVST